MKSKFQKIAFVVAVAVVGGINVYNAQKPAPLSDIGMANVEALASDETKPNISYGYILRDCKDSQGRVTGKRCELYYPSAECNNRDVWGECY